MLCDSYFEIIIYFCEVIGNERDSVKEYTVISFQITKIRMEMYDALYRDTASKVRDNTNSVSE